MVSNLLLIRHYNFPGKRFCPLANSLTEGRQCAFTVPPPPDTHKTLLFSLIFGMAGRTTAGNYRYPGELQTMSFVTVQYPPLLQPRSARKCSQHILLYMLSLLPPPQACKELAIIHAVMLTRNTLVYANPPPPPPKRPISPRRLIREMKRLREEGLKLSDSL